MKKVIITGANEGIGYNIVKQLLLKNNYVAVLDINISNLREFENIYQEHFMAIECDVKDDKSINNAISKCIDKFENVDIAIHNACICTFDSMENTLEHVYKDVFEVNFYGALRLTRAIIPHMKENKKGKIIFTSSGVGVMGFTNISPYASSKGAIESLAKCLNIEYQEFGITFHIYHPPLTRTKSSSPLPVPKEFMADPFKVGKGLAKNINKKSFIICHSFGQKLQTIMCYLFPIKIGKFLSMMTKNVH